MTNLVRIFLIDLVFNFVSASLVEFIWKYLYEIGKCREHEHCVNECPARVHLTVCGQPRT